MSARQLSDSYQAYGCTCKLEKIKNQIHDSINLKISSVLTLTTLSGDLIVIKNLYTTI